MGSDLEVLRDKHGAASLISTSSSIHPSHSLLSKLRHLFNASTRFPSHRSHSHVRSFTLSVMERRQKERWHLHPKHRRRWNLSVKWKRVSEKDGEKMKIRREKEKWAPQGQVLCVCEILPHLCHLPHKTPFIFWIKDVLNKRFLFHFKALRSHFINKYKYTLISSIVWQLTLNSTTVVPAFIPHWTFGRLLASDLFHLLKKASHCDGKSVS